MSLNPRFGPQHNWLCWPSQWNGECDILFNDNCQIDIHQFNQKLTIIVFKSDISKVKKNAIKFIWFLKVWVISFTLPRSKFEAWKLHYFKNWVFIHIHIINAIPPRLRFSCKSHIAGIVLIFNILDSMKRNIVWEFIIEHVKFDISFFSPNFHNKHQSP